VTINSGNFKSITGGDGGLPAEKKFHDPYSITPQCKVILCCNNKPRLSETGGAMERRIAVVPFEADFTKAPDKDLPEKLLAEAPAILAVLIGCAGRYYGKKELPESETIRNASRAYMLDEDVIAQFIAEKCEVKDGAFTPRDEMEKAVNDFLGEKSMSKKAIKERFEANGFNIKQSGKGENRGKKGFDGIRLLLPLEM